MSRTTTTGKPAKRLPPKQEPKPAPRRPVDKNAASRSKQHPDAEESNETAQLPAADEVIDRRQPRRRQPDYRDEVIQTRDVR